MSLLSFFTRSVPILVSGQLVSVPTKFGWMPDPPDARDAAYNIFSTPIADTQVGDCDNRQYFKPISHQLNLPFCTANAGADAWEAALVHALVKKGKSLGEAHALVPELSRVFAIYWGHSFMDPSQALNIEAGCYNRLIMEVIARLGLPPESLWPYDTKVLPPNNLPRPCVRPSLAASRAAYKYKSGAFYNIPHDNRYKLVEGVDKALSAGHNVVWGTAVGINFTKYEGGVIRPGDKIGRHAMVLCGKKDGNYIDRNSWGEGWGDNGYCLVSPEFLAWSESKSFWVCVPEDVP